MKSAQFSSLARSVAANHRSFFGSWTGCKTCQKRQWRWSTRLGGGRTQITLGRILLTFGSWAVGQVQLSISAPLYLTPNASLPSSPTLRLSVSLPSGAVILWAHAAS